MGVRFNMQIICNRVQSSELPSEEISKTSFFKHCIENFEYIFTSSMLNFCSNYYNQQLKDNISNTNSSSIVSDINIINITTTTTANYIYLCTEYRCLHIFLCLNCYFSSPFYSFQVVISLLSHSCFFLHPLISRSSFSSSSSWT